MKVELDTKEMQLLIGELETVIRELRGLIASGMRKDMRDDIRKDKMMLIDILEKVKMAGRVKEHHAAA